MYLKVFGGFLAQCTNIKLHMVARLFP